MKLEHLHEWLQEQSEDVTVKVGLSQGIFTVKIGGPRFKVQGVGPVSPEDYGEERCMLEVLLAKAMEGYVGLCEGAAFSFPEEDDDPVFSVESSDEEEPEKVSADEPIAYVPVEPPAPEPVIAKLGMSGWNLERLVLHYLGDNPSSTWIQVADFVQEIKPLQPAKKVREAVVDFLNYESLGGGRLLRTIKDDFDGTVLYALRHYPPEETEGLGYVPSTWAIEQVVLHCVHTSPRVTQEQIIRFVARNKRAVPLVKVSELVTRFLKGCPPELAVRTDTRGVHRYSLKSDYDACAENGAGCPGCETCR